MHNTGTCEKDSADPGKPATEGAFLSAAGHLAADGSALMVHEKPDNFGNVPDRYAPALDDVTKKTGDAGPRIACGALQP